MWSTGTYSSPIHSNALRQSFLESEISSERICCCFYCVSIDTRLPHAPILTIFSAHGKFNAINFRFGFSSEIKRENVDVGGGIQRQRQQQRHCEHHWCLKWKSRSVVRRNKNYDRNLNRNSHFSLCFMRITRTKLKAINCIHMYEYSLDAIYSFFCRCIWRFSENTAQNANFCEGVPKD